MRYAIVARVVSDGEVDLLLVEWGTGGIDVLECPDDLSPDSGNAILVNRHNEVEAIIDPVGGDRGNTIGVVKKVLDERAVVDVGGRLSVYDIGDGVTVKEDNTVEISDRAIIEDCINPSPIQRDSLIPEKTDINEYVDDLRFSSEELTVGFEDFGGMWEQLEHVQKRVDLMLNSRDKLEQVGTEPKLGALFYGKPGTGKTFFAKILASESNANFYRIRGPEIVTKWVGDTEEILRALFQDAKNNEPSILFFDEIDSLGSKRGDGPNQQFGNRVVAQLLSLMDGVDKASEGLLVIGSTNRVDDIDEALLRPGRLDWKVKFEIPDSQGRAEIFNSLRQEYEVADSVDAGEIASMTEGWNGADLESLLNEAGIISVNAGREQITMTDLIISYERRADQL
ncbi:ATP-binding protein [Halobellus inordinatus]|uniref:ATP-binding protein n=1 Tax=Halobellus inordinatus TaxID=1126236 RepID=UPI00210B3D3B|nr:AAA family ATPase [Halobellus inordinatus]